MATPAASNHVRRGLPQRNLCLASLWRRGLSQRNGWQEAEGAGVCLNVLCGKRACGAGVCPSASPSGKRAVGEFLSLLSLAEVQVTK